MFNYFDLSHFLKNLSNGIHECLLVFRDDVSSFQELLVISKDKKLNKENFRCKETILRITCYHQFSWPEKKYKNLLV